MSDYEDDRPPRKVYWAGRQWCVTDYGLETVAEDEYYVEAARLGGLTDGVDVPMAERLRHISEKTWVDIEDLFAAFSIAVLVHADNFEPFPAGALLNAMEAARRGRWEEEAFSLERKRRGHSAVTMTEMHEIDEAIRPLVTKRLEEGPPFSEVPDPARAEGFAPVYEEDDDDDD